MKGWFKLLVLATVPILAATAVVDQGLAADKGSQLIFQSNIAHQNFISVVNAQPDGNAVTVLVQYYNNDMEMAVWYLRVIPGGSSVLVDPFDHMIPGTEKNVGDEIMGSGKAGNGHFVIAVTAVAAQLDVGEAPNGATTANALFPTSLAEDLHGMGNIDACGTIRITAVDDAADPDMGHNNLMLINPEDDEIKCADDMTSANVADWGVGDAEVIAFNHLTGHFTEALEGTPEGGSDQTASWGGTPVVRPVVLNKDNDMIVDSTTIAEYQVLDGTPEANLAEKDAAGVGITITTEVAEGHIIGTDNEGIEDPDDSNQMIPTINDEDRTNRVLATADQLTTDNGVTEAQIEAGIQPGAMVLPALHGGGAYTKQIMLLLSVADEIGDAGGYKLIPAMTAIDVTLMDSMGNPLEMMADEEDSGIVGGGTEDPEAESVSTKIIVNGVNVMVNAGDCSGDMIDGPWTLANLTALVPEATAGHGDFTGLDNSGADPMMNGSKGWIKFARGSLTCKEQYGDGDPPDLSAFEQPDGIPADDERTYVGGTLVVEETTESRTFVTTGRALLKFITPDSTFAASWTLKSPPSPNDPTESQ